MGEEVVSAHLLKEGFHVSKPVGDYRPYDLIAERPCGRLVKVQVKYLYQTSKHRFSTGNDLTKYKKGDFDYLAVVFPTNLEVRFVHFRAIGKRARMSFKQEK